MKGGGIGNHRNVGLDVAQGGYIALTDDGDAKQNFLNLVDISESLTESAEEHDAGITAYRLNKEKSDITHKCFFNAEMVVAL
jgi:hypothetical protein